MEALDDRFPESVMTVTQDCVLCVSLNPRVYLLSYESTGVSDDDWVI